MFVLIVNFDILKNKLLIAFAPYYIRLSLIGGSIVLWIYVIQVISGYLLAMIYPWLFDLGIPGMFILWWETTSGSILSRIHAEVANLVFFTLYLHILYKMWVQAYQAELDQTWLTGIIIMAFTYVAGITGAIMPCSILGEVTATVIGYAISSLTFVKFDFLETLMLPGLGLTDESLFRVFVLHAAFPSLGLIVAMDHIDNLHSTEYTDEDEIDVLFLFRHEYWNEFMWLEVGYWYEILFMFLFFRFITDFFWPSYMTVTYSLSNFEYWPLTEDIDFALAIPHWYLRPLMGSLVLIPHHYLGFFYVIFFFISFFILPWTEDHKSICFTETISDFIYVRLSLDLNYIVAWIFLLFVLLLIFSTAIVPTGRYFVSLGSSEFLAYAYWFLIFYLLFFLKLGLYLFLSFYFYSC